MKGYRIVQADEELLHSLPAIEQAAVALFDAVDLPPALRQKTIAVEELLSAANQGHLWVAVSSTDEPVGFALVSVQDDTVHLEEMDVHSAHVRQGIGRALVQTICDRAREQGFEAVTLTTFRRLAWNAPFYARLGFVSLSESELTLMLTARQQNEAKLGLSNRTAMKCELT